MFISRETTELKQFIEHLRRNLTERPGKGSQRIKDIGGEKCVGPLVQFFTGGCYYLQTFIYFQKYETCRADSCKPRQ